MVSSVRSWGGGWVVDLLNWKIVNLNLDGARNNLKFLKRIPFQKLGAFESFHFTIIWLPSKIFIGKICTLSQTTSPHARKPLLAFKPRIRRLLLIYNPFSFGIIAGCNSSDKVQNLLVHVHQIDKIINKSMWNLKGILLSIT